MTDLTDVVSVAIRGLAIDVTSNRRPRTPGACVVRSRISGSGAFELTVAFLKRAG